MELNRIKMVENLWFVFFVFLFYCLPIGYSATLDPDCNPESRLHSFLAKNYNSSRCYLLPESFLGCHKFRLWIKHFGNRILAIYVINRKDRLSNVTRKVGPLVKLVRNNLSVLELQWVFQLEIFKCLVCVRRARIFEVSHRKLLVYQIEFQV